MRRRNEEQPSKHNRYNFALGDHKQLTISSDFESGNIRLLKQINPLSYLLQALSDVDNSHGRKSWYYFRVEAPIGYRIRFALQNVVILQSCQQSKSDYQPLVRIGADGSWESLTNAFLSTNDEPTLLFDYRFNTQEEVYFCLTVPFTYTDQNNYLHQLQDVLPSRITYRNQLLALTPQKRELRLLTLTENTPEQTEAQIQAKPVVLVTCRVHAGEVSSSYVLMGILEMLAEDTLQGYLLRRLFEWKIVPMLNPDGVVAGNYRLDPLGGNLNRFYSDPSPQEHPAIAAVMQVVKEVNEKGRRIDFYFDLHSHSTLKEAFVYGNALEDIGKQAYTQLFCKILEENTPWFRAGLCDFGERQMKHRDRGEDKTKEGCGRVIMYKVAKVVRSYTLQSSMIPHFYCRPQRTELKPVRNCDFFHCPEGSDHQLGRQANAKDSKEVHPMVTANKELGRAILASVLDMVGKNPFSRLSLDFNTSFLKDIAPKLLQSEERFRTHDSHSYYRARNVHKIVQQEIEKATEQAWQKAGLSIEFGKGSWPQEFKPIEAPAPPSVPQKLNRTVRLHSEMTDFRERKMRIRSQLKTEKQIFSETTAEKNENCQINETRQLEEPLFSIANRGKERHSLQMHYSLELPVEDISAKVMVEIFGDRQQVSIDRMLKPSSNWQQQNFRKNTPRKYLVTNISPSIALLQTTKLMDKEKYRKLKGGNFYKVFVENRKKTDSCFHKGSAVDSRTNPPSALGPATSLGLSCSEERKAGISRVDVNLGYRQGFESIKGRQKAEMRLPCMYRFFPRGSELSV